MTGSLRIIEQKKGDFYFAKLTYKDSTGRRKYKTISMGLPVKDNKRKAERMLGKLIKKYSYLENTEEYSGVIDPDISLAEYIDYFLESNKAKVSISTYETKEYTCGRIKRELATNPIFNENNNIFRVIDGKPKNMNRFLEYLLKQGKIHPETGEKSALSVRTVRSYKNVLSEVYDSAIIEGLTDINPLASLKVSKKDKDELSGEIFFLNQDEISEFLHFLAEKYPRMFGVGFLGAYYGLRRSEILGLKWSAIDFNKKTMQINHTVIRQKTIRRQDTTKTVAGKRELALSENAEKMLMNLLKEQEANKAFFKDAYIHSDYIFTKEDGELYRPDYLTKIIKKALTEFGRPELSLHKLRHSCATLLFDKGWDYKKVQYWLGHTDIQTTMNIYVHYNRMKENLDYGNLNELSEPIADLVEEMYFDGFGGKIGGKIPYNDKNE